jgi:hypothetical protein
VWILEVVKWHCFYAGDKTESCSAPHFHVQVTEEALANFFSECGPVQDCRICGDPNSAMRFAFLEFADVESAQRVSGWLVQRDLHQLKLQVYCCKQSTPSLMPVTTTMSCCSRSGLASATRVDLPVLLPQMLTLRHSPRVVPSWVPLPYVFFPPRLPSSQFLRTSCLAQLMRQVVYLHPCIPIC